MEEISLKEVIQIIMKGKFIIIITTIAALIIGAVAYKLIPEEYSTTTSILANPINNNSDTPDYIDKLILPAMDIASYEQQFLNSFTLGKTITDLELKDSQGEYITQNTLKSKVTIENPAKTNLLNINVTDSDPEIASKIANRLSRNFIAYITDLYQRSASVSEEAISAQLEIEEANLDKHASILRDYLTNSENIDTLNSEITSLIEQITLNKANINTLESTVTADTISLQQLKQASGIEGLDHSQLQINAIIDNTSFYTGSYNLELATGNNLEKTLLTLKITDIEARLVENINTLAATKSKTDELEVRLSDLQSRRAEEQYKYNSIERDYSMAESIYETYKSQYREAIILKTSNLGAVNVKIISESLVPVNPANKNLMLTCAIASVLGIFMGTFIVLFKSYWLSEETSIDNSIKIPIEDTIIGVD